MSLLYSLKKSKSEGKEDRQTEVLEFLTKDKNTPEVKYVSETLHWDRQHKSLQKQTLSSQNHPEDNYMFNVAKQLIREKLLFISK